MMELLYDLATGWKHCVAFRVSWLGHHAIFTTDELSFSPSLILKQTLSFQFSNGDFLRDCILCVAFSVLDKAIPPDLRAQQVWAQSMLLVCQWLKVTALEGFEGVCESFQAIFVGCKAKAQQNPFSGAVTIARDRGPQGLAGFFVKQMSQDPLLRSRIQPCQSLCVFKKTEMLWMQIPNYPTLATNSNNLQQDKQSTTINSVLTFAYQ